jgi:hypothetical protein
MTLKVKARTNEPGTCLWCGERARKDGFRHDPTGNKQFCTVRCAMLFGEAAALNGFRFAPRHVLAGAASSPKVTP